MGGRKTRLNNIYAHIKTRCYNPKSDHYKYYGARGITICEEWLNPEVADRTNGMTKGFEAFKKWALENGYQENLTIDRIDVNGNYCPENCRWVTRKIQMNNTRRNHLLTYKGETKNITEWAKITGISVTALTKRICRNWTIERALETK